MQTDQGVGSEGGCFHICCKRWNGHSKAEGTRKRNDSLDDNLAVTFLCWASQVNFWEVIINCGASVTEVSGSCAFIIYSDSEYAEKSSAWKQVPQIRKHLNFLKLKI